MRTTGYEYLEDASRGVVFFSSFWRTGRLIARREMLFTNRRFAIFLMHIFEDDRLHEPPFIQRGEKVNT